LRSDVIESGIAKHSGRLFKVMGDGFLGGIRQRARHRSRSDVCRRIYRAFRGAQPGERDTSECRTAEAKAALEKAVAISPASFDFQVRERPPWFRPPQEHAHMLDGLRKAGWEG
jgi:class 3 adenylate cyclase